MSITLYDEQLNPSKFAGSKPNLKELGNFKRADVTAGTWIFYTDINYNKEGNKEGKNQTFQFVEGCRADPVRIDSVNGSMFLIDEGLILFEHFGFGGDRKWFQDDQEDLTGLFPVETEEGEDDKKSGVSSAILLSKNRSVALFTEANFGGKKYTLQPGEWCEKVKYTDDNQAGQNDKWLSFKFI